MLIYLSSWYNLLNAHKTIVKAQLRLTRVGFLISFSCLLTCLIVGVSNDRRVNLYCVFGPDGELGEHKEFILVRAECPYVQFEAAHVTGSEICSTSYKRVREG
jgi:hypothetical protein